VVTFTCFQLVALTNCWCELGLKQLLTRNSKSDIMPGALCDAGVLHQVSLSPVVHLRHVRHFTFRYLHQHT